MSNQPADDGFIVGARVRYADPVIGSPTEGTIAYREGEYVGVSDTGDRVHVRDLRLVTPAPSSSRVVYASRTNSKLTGKRGVLITSNLNKGTHTMVRFDNGTEWLCNQNNIYSVPEAPDVITIDRADLPEVVASDEQGIFRVGGTRHYVNLAPQDVYKQALKSLALAEFLEARERQAAEDEEAERVGEALHKAKVNDLAGTIAAGLEKRRVSGTPRVVAADCVGAAEALLAAGWKIGGE